MRIPHTRPIDFERLLQEMISEFSTQTNQAPSLYSSVHLTNVVATCREIANSVSSVALIIENKTALSRNQAMAFTQNVFNGQRSFTTFIWNVVEASISRFKFRDRFIALNTPTKNLDETISSKQEQ